MIARNIFKSMLSNVIEVTLNAHVVSMYDLNFQFYLIGVPTMECCSIAVNGNLKWSILFETYLM